MQKNIFLKSEADAWCDRNKSALTIEEHDKRILEYLRRQEFESVLEVGCGSGHRLSYLKTNFPDIACYGCDPSAKAVANSGSGIHLEQGTADNLPYESNSFDVVIVGFCLYLCDVEDYFTIGKEINRVLRNNGILIIIDFEPPFAYQNNYVHCEGVRTTKMQYRNMFTWHPSYTVSELYAFTHHGNKFDADPNERISVSILHKTHGKNLPLEPFTAK